MEHVQVVEMEIVAISFTPTTIEDEVKCWIVNEQNEHILHEIAERVLKCYLFLVCFEFVFSY